MRVRRTRNILSAGIASVHKPRHAHHATAAWLGFIALVYQALLPAYAMAAMAQPAGDAIPICSASGIVWVSLDESGRPIAPQNSAAEKPCHFCLGTAMVLTPPRAVEAAARRALLDRLAFRLAGDLAMPEAQVSLQPIRAPPPIA